MCFLCLAILIFGCAGCRQEEQKINGYIDSFITNHLVEYVCYDDQNDKLDYHVVAGLGALKELKKEVSYTIDKDKLEANFNTTSQAYPTAYLAPALVYRHLFTFEAAMMKAQLSSYTAEDIMYSQNYVALMLDAMEVNSVFSKELVEGLAQTEYPSADYAGISLMASAKYDVEQSVFHDMIATDLTPTGVKGYLGTASASSTACVIMGLVAIGMDPNNYVVGSDTFQLVDNLLAFIKEDGSCKESLESEEVDLAYATPQAFAALCAYEVYVQTNQAYVLF